MSDLDRAETLRDLRRWAGAEQAIRSHLTQEPDSARAMRLLSDVLHSQDRHPEALEAARRAVELDPDHQDSHLLLSHALLGVGEVERAREAALTSVRIAPWAWQTHYTFGMALRGGRRPRSRDALAAANEAVRLAPHSSNAHNLAGLCLDDLGLGTEARRAYEEALRLDPGNAVVLNNLAVVEVESGRLGAASRFLTSGLGHDAQERVLHRNYDALLMRLLRRLYLAVLGVGLVLLSMLALEAPWFLRAATGAGLLALLGVLVRRVTRELPRGSARWTRGLFRRSSWWGRLVIALFVVLVLGVLSMSVLPRQAGLTVGVLTLVVLRTGGYAAIARWFIGLLLGRLRRT